MSYATLDDLIARAGSAEIGEIADRDGNGTPDPTVIAAALAAADQTIDGYLAVRFALPLTAIPPLVVKWAISIARYHLHRDGAPDYVVRDYKEAFAELRDAAAGRLMLPDAAGAVPPNNSLGGAQAAGTAPVFTAEALEGWL